MFIDLCRPLLKEFEWFTYRESDFFSKWIDLMLYALCEEEKKYMDIVNIYLNRNQRELVIKYSEMCGLLHCAMAKANHDLLGVLYEQEATRNKRSCFGQFFTPHHVCDMMALLGKSDIGDTSNEVATDPCCGTGRLLISSLKAGFQGKFFAQDLDPLCTKMTALNMCFFNTDSYVLNGNSLSWEVNFGYKTTKHWLGGSVRELTKEECKEIEEIRKKNFIKKEPEVINLSKKNKTVKKEENTLISVSIDPSLRSLF